MRVECAWCRKGLPPKGEETDDVSHSVCLSCIDDVLCKIGEEAEHNSWLLAFKLERKYSNRTTEMTRDGNRQALRRLNPEGKDTADLTIRHRQGA